MSILSLNERQRRLIIPAGGVLLAVFFVLVFQPLARRAESLDAPLEAEWRRLAAAVGPSNAATLDFGAIAASLRQTRESLAVVNAARRQARQRVEVGPELRERLNSTFQLVDFQNEVQRQIAELQQLAAQRKVALDPAVVLGFPEHTADVRQPELLWAELAFVHDLLTLAIQSQVTGIQGLSLPAGGTNRVSATPVGRVVAIPVQLQLTGPTPAVNRFLSSLPRRADEFDEPGLPPALTNKPALFLDRFLIRKEAPAQPDQVSLYLRAVGYVFRD